ncbi:NAD(P)-binding domain-containing protein [Candidatus Micrarchaeota archaeon]|nr:NAD(P)-binding domain-containing protein [Candidatus Micrarchaeota archaeon]
MKIGIIGSGTVGKALAEGFLKNSHEVMIGTRDASKLSEWLVKNKAKTGSNAEAAKFGELIVLCVNWHGLNNALELSGKENFAGKIVIDVTNPLVFEKQGEAPKLALGYPESAGARIQKMLPDSKVVKCFNIVTAKYMCNPRLQEGTADMLVCGNDAESKETVSKIASEWGWPIHDLGGIENAYLMESIAMAWIVYGFNNNHWTHAFKILQK